MSVTRNTVEADSYYAAFESAGAVALAVQRKGDPLANMSVDYTTDDPTSKAGQHYPPILA